MCARFQTASQTALPPQQDLLLIDPLVAANTRFSPSRTHRYTLFRHWGDPANYCAFIGMNPSGADEASLDRTVNRCCEFARRWGFSALYMLNAFSLRATNPEELYAHPDPVGPENDHWISVVVSQARRVVVAWGTPGGDFNRGTQVEQLLRENCPLDRVVCFGRNKNGTPVHPLYQSYERPLVPYFATAPVQGGTG